MEGVRGEDIGVDQLLGLEREGGPPGHGEEAIGNLGGVLLGEDLHHGLVGGDGHRFPTDQAALGGAVGKHPSNGSERVLGSVKASVGVAIVN